MGAIFAKTKEEPEPKVRLQNMPEVVLLRIFHFLESKDLGNIYLANCTGRLGNLAFREMELEMKRKEERFLKDLKTWTQAGNPETDNPLEKRLHQIMKKTIAVLEANHDDEDQ